MSVRSPALKGQGCQRSHHHPPRPQQSPATMGFPVGYSDLFLPRFILRVFFLLALLRSFLLWALRAIGLARLLEPDDDDSARRSLLLQRRRPAFRPLAPLLALDDALPVVRLDELLAAGDEASAPLIYSDGCAVCLCHIGGDDEVRRQCNCRHVFHRGCLDRWMAAHEHRTCPLCRAPLFPADAGEITGIPAADSDPGEYESWLFGDSADFSPMPSPAFLRPQQLMMGTAGEMVVDDARQLGRWTD